MRYFRLPFLFTLFIASALVLAGAAYAAGDKCSVCGMKISGNENTAYEISFKDGKSETYCCPHCGLWAQNEQGDNAASARARDFISGEWQDATKMVYLFKSTAVPACSPSWIAFSSEGDAQNFQKGFGGAILTFDEALRERAQHPKAMKMHMK